MKKTLIAFAIMSVTASTSFAQSSVTLFGVVDVAMRNVENGSLGSMNSEVSGASSTSRWGMRGSEDLGNGLSAQFWLESGINVDSGAGTTAAQLFDRRSTIGLESKTLGELRLGRDYRPTHVLWSAFDPYSTNGVGSANQFNSTSASVKGAGVDVTRASNSIQYILPKNMSGFDGGLFASMDEGSTVALGSASSRGGRLGFTSGPINVSASIVTVSNTPTYELKDSVIGASYDFGVAKIVLARRTFTWGQDKQVLTLLAATAPLGKGTMKVSYMEGDQSGAAPAADSRDASQIALGYVYDLSKRSALYGTVSKILNQNSAAFVVPGGVVGMLGGQSSTGYEFGIRHSF